jgi:ABC-type antimicrobial peptide transport system permease subunit
MVVGVARDAMYESVGAAPHAHFYLPVLQNYESYMQLHVRLRCAAASSECEMGTVAAAVRREMRALDASLGSGDVTTIEQVRRESLLPSQVGVGFISGFGGLALLLAAVGLYGVMSYTVAGRTREIGIRVALGARRGDVMHLVVSEGMRLAGFGMLVGGSVAMVIAFALSRVLYGVRAVDLTALPAVLTLLSIVALAATWGPAWRAARVDPVEALRRE